jgi:uncharacterized protein YheU (UPF0270 family)
MVGEIKDSSQNKEKAPRERALEYCLKLERGQRLSATAFQWAYFFSQFAAVVFSGITPILILLDNTPKFVQAIPPAIASISAGLAVYNWRSSSVRSRIALASLESERLNYELRVGTDYGSEHSEEEALAHFRNKVTQINLGVLRDWERVVLEEASNLEPSKAES